MLHITCYKQTKHSLRKSYNLNCHILDQANSIYGGNILFLPDLNNNLVLADFNSMWRTFYKGPFKNGLPADFVPLWQTILKRPCIRCKILITHMGVLAPRSLITMAIG